MDGIITATRSADIKVTLWEYKQDMTSFAIIKQVTIKDSSEQVWMTHLKY